jgi:phage shock protein PspC (stress-responsive transcriptional regulator)
MDEQPDGPHRPRDRDPDDAPPDAGHGSAGPSAGEDARPPPADDTAAEPGGPPRRVLRRSPNPMLGGVAGGFADYFVIDATLARLVFVGLGLWGGLGVLLYLVCWVVIPPAGAAGSGAAGSPAAGSRAGSVSGGPSGQAAARVVGIVLLVVAGFAALGAVVSGVFFPGRWWPAAPFGMGSPAGAWPIWPWRPSVFVAIGLVVLGVLLYRMGDDVRRPRDAASTGDPAQPGGAGAAWTAPADEPARQPAGPAGEAASLATAPPAARPEPGRRAGIAPDTSQSGPDRFGGGVLPPTPPPSRPPSPLGRVTLAVALLAVGVAAILDRAGLADLTLAGLLSIALVAVGVGLVVGAWWGRARWLIAVGFALLPFVLVAAILPALHWDGMGTFDATAADRTYRPATLDELRDEYRLATGRILLDLRGLELAEGEEPDVTVDVAAGQIEVLLPADAGAVVSARAIVGAVELLDWEAGGLVVTEDRVLPGTGPGSIRLDLSVRAGEIVVRRPFGPPPGEAPSGEPPPDADVGDSGGVGRPSTVTAGRPLGHAAGGVR